MNERAVALLMNVSPKTVLVLSTGAARPCSIARRLMQIYEAGPELIGRLIAGAEDGQ